MPLTDAYRRLGELLPVVRVAVGRAEAGRWIHGVSLATDFAVIERLIEAEEARAVEAYGTTPRRDVAATWVLRRYAFTACLAMSAPWFLERRVPRVALDRVAYAWQDRELVVEVAEISCLPGDSLEGQAGVRTVADETALRAELRDAVAAHLAPVLEAFGPVLRRRPRTMWGFATDQLANGIWHLGTALEQPMAAALAANALLPGATPPYLGGAGFRLGPDSPRTQTTCCLFYTVRPDELCATCPRLAQIRHA
ncbi:(2Fe-2S)-binding protein [Nocardia sp. NPDC051832]|uniref:(2Fe-2S)-binding protein n=1 Tax=Nocardia sp. NPDC051832 TaxID=3155673 RepID=UPI003426AFC4